MQGKQRLCRSNTTRQTKKKSIDILRDKRTCGSHEAIKEYYFLNLEKDNWNLTDFTFLMSFCLPPVVTLH